MATIKYLGHSSFELHAGGKSFLIDPWFSPFNRNVPSIAHAGDFKKVDFILVTHEHFDHCDKDAIEEICGRTFSPVLAPRETLGQLNIAQRLKHSVDVGDNFSLFGAAFEIIEAHHPQSTHPVGFIVKVEENGAYKTVYFAGDTYDFYGMTRISCDVAVLPVGGTYTMDELAVIKALKQMKAKYLIPSHYNTFDRIKLDVDNFARRVQKDTKTIPVPLKIGQEFKF